jgi:hypothetical protein
MNQDKFASASLFLLDPVKGMTLVALIPPDPSRGRVSPTISASHPQLAHGFFLDSLQGSLNVVLKLSHTAHFAFSACFRV